MRQNNIGKTEISLKWSGNSEMMTPLRPPSKVVNRYASWQLKPHIQEPSSLDA